MKYTPCLNDCCFFTGTPKEYCEVHHVFYGNPDRKLSEKWAMKVYLVPSYHRNYPNGVHRNKANDLMVKQYAQQQFELQHGHDKFMEVFKKNYL